MDATYTLKQIADALGISRARAEQWIARGFFRTPHNPIFGAAREWQISDAIRLALCAALVDAGLSPEQAGAFTQVAHGFKKDAAYLVVSELGEIIPATPRGAPGTKKGEGIKVRTPGVLHSEIVKAADLAKKLDDPDGRAVTVINLDNRERWVKNALGYNE
jgi:hypothetical protein